MRLDDESDDYEEEELDSELSDETEVTCPYCGQTTTIALDPAGGRAQSYIEDCEVCCRPWQLTVTFDEDGVAEVVVEAESE